MSPRWLLRRTVRRLGRRKLAFAGMVVAFATLGLLAGGAHTVAVGAETTTARLGDEAHVIVYLADDLGLERRRGLAGAVERMPTVERVHEVDGRAALAHLSRELRAMGEDPALAASVEAGFLPTSLEIVLAAGPDLPSRAADLTLRLRRLPGVAKVDAMTGGLLRLAGFEALARRLAGLLGAAAILAAAVLCAGVVARERSRQREEADTLALLGVQPAAARLPAGVAGALAALAGGLIGLPAGGHLGALAFTGVESPGLPGSELLLTAALLAAAGLAVGCLTIPARRLVDVRG